MDDPTLTIPDASKHLRTESSGPEWIRQLRGSLTRAAFGQRLGVTALTVYRWELPPSAAEARRPRGRVLERLQRYAAAQDAGQQLPREATEPAPRSAHTASDLERSEYERVLPILARLPKAELRRAESELLSLLTQGELKSRAARALATQALARVSVFARGDGRSAFSTLMPLVSDVEQGLLPAAVELAVHVTAALVFSSPDGRLFDAGKATVHVARAERLLDRHGSAEDRLLLAVSSFSVGFMLDDRQLSERALSRAQEVLHAHTAPLPRVIALYLAAVQMALSGRVGASIRRFQELVELAESRELSLFASHALAHMAEALLEEAADPSEVVALCERARRLTYANRHSSSLQTMLLSCAHGEALARMGRFAEAELQLRDAVEQCQELGWTPVFVTCSLVRLYVLTGDVAGLREHAELLIAYDRPLQRAITQAEGRSYRALAQVMEGAAPAALLAAFDAVEALADQNSHWWFVLRNATLLNLAIRMGVGDVLQAELALGRAERTLDVMPSAWASANLRYWRALLLCRQGRALEARPALEAAVATFELAKLVPEAALSRAALADLLTDLGDASADALSEQSRHELERLGIRRSASLRRESLAAAALFRASSAPRALEAQPPGTRLMVPIQRLSVRGMAPALIQRELLAVLEELFPLASLRLEELDASGVSRTLLEVPAAQKDGQHGELERVELGDGSGRRLRVSARGKLPADAHAVLSSVAAVASLSLEIASLRGFAEPVGPQRSEDVPELPGFIAMSPGMRALKQDLLRLSRSRSTVIISGESGSGKEVVARAIHELSPRAAQPFVAFNCAAIPRELFEGQLFGYKRGAYTGATADHAGVIRSARGGTLFLDEVGELPLDVQPKLLRFLENGEIFPLGERRAVQVDVRVIAATHRDLDALQRRGQFREDLFYRLQVVPVHVPPLCERREDIVALARHFLRLQSPPDQEPPILAPDAIATLLAYDWPGNVRELRNVIERSLVFASMPSVLSAEHLRIHPGAA